jgi:hypothetical protein
MVNKASRGRTDRPWLAIYHLKGNYQRELLDKRGQSHLDILTHTVSLTSKYRIHPIHK